MFAKLMGVIILQVLETSVPHCAGPRWWHQVVCKGVSPQQGKSLASFIYTSFPDTFQTSTIRQNIFKFVVRITTSSKHRKYKLHRCRDVYETLLLSIHRISVTRITHQC